MPLAAIDDFGGIFVGDGGPRRELPVSAPAAAATCEAGASEAPVRSDDGGRTGAGGYASSRPSSASDFAVAPDERAEREFGRTGGVPAVADDGESLVGVRPLVRSNDREFESAPFDCDGASAEATAFAAGGCFGSGFATAAALATAEVPCFLSHALYGSSIGSPQD